MAIKGNVNVNVTNRIVAIISEPEDPFADDDFKVKEILQSVEEQNAVVPQVETNEKNECNQIMKIRNVMKKTMCKSPQISFFFRIATLVLLEIYTFMSTTINLHDLLFTQNII